MVTCFATADAEVFPLLIPLFWSLFEDKTLVLPKDIESNLAFFLAFKPVVPFTAFFKMGLEAPFWGPLSSGSPVKAINKKSPIPFTPNWCHHTDIEFDDIDFAQRKNPQNSARKLGKGWGTSRYGGSSFDMNSILRSSLIPYTKLKSLTS